MIIKDEKLLATFRAGPCEVCGLQVLTDPHHIHERGMGGGNRLDVAINLVSLCRSCHDHVHAGGISREELLAMAATREIRKLQRQPK